MTDRPKMVYKYESYNVRSLINLKSQSLYFGSPRLFNDPYDCAITATIADPTPDQIEVIRQHYKIDPSTPPQIKKQLSSLPLDELRINFIKGATEAIKKERKR